MPPRRRTAAADDASYDGVPTVNVVLDAEPESAVEEQETSLDVVEVPAVDATDSDAAASDGD